MSDEKQDEKKDDDLEALRKIIDALEPLKKHDQERVIRWALEKLGISANTAAPQSFERRAPEDKSAFRDAVTRAQSLSSEGVERDIKTFITEKNPTSDNQFAATVAYYYQFEAPPDKRKETISAADLQEACRQTGRVRLGDPGKTLRNAHDVGLLDKSGDRGAYKINTVGENLVAVTLPSGGNTSSSIGKKKRKVKKKKAKK